MDVSSHGQYAFQWPRDPSSASTPPRFLPHHPNHPSRNFEATTTTTTYIAIPERKAYPATSTRPTTFHITHHGIRPPPLEILPHNPLPLIQHPNLRNLQTEIQPHIPLLLQLRPLLQSAPDPRHQRRLRAGSARARTLRPDLGLRRALRAGVQGHPARCYNCGEVGRLG